MQENHKEMDSILYGIFYDVFKRSGFSLSPDQLHKLRRDSEHLAKFITSTISSEVDRLTSKLLKTKVEVILDLERRVSKLEDRNRSES